MIKLVLLIISIKSILSNMTPRVNSITPRVLLTYRFNIQDSPQKRWAPIMKNYAVPFDNMMDFLDQMPIPPNFYEGFEWFARNIFKYQDLVSEIDAIAKITGHPFEKVFFLSLIYVFADIPACTGFLIRNKDDGSIIHGRNLDFQMQQLLTGLLVSVEYYKDGKKLYSSNLLAGSPFPLAGVRQGAFSINLNTRSHRPFELNLINAIIDNVIPVGWLVKQTLEEQTNYYSANFRLRNQRIQSPIYIIIAGLKGNEGMVIERQADGVHAYYELSDQVWFLVQTNYDRSNPDPTYDQRRVPMENRIKTEGNNYTPQKVFKQLTVSPTFNILTIMTAVMIPKTGYHNTTAWEGVVSIHKNNLQTQ